MCKKLLVHYINNENKRVWQPCSINPVKYPKALEFLSTLQQKYPNHLKNFTCYISNYPDMKATATDVYYRARS